ncbi:MAG: BppU family phage baseplate upper protein [Nitrososphaeraceae archaeon]
MTQLAAYLKIDQKTLFRNDFSSSSSYRFSGTIYTDRPQTTAFNLTGYTLTIRFFKEWYSSDFFDKAATINVAASGTWYYNVASGDLPTPGIYMCKVELTKSGEQISTLNRVEILIKDGATA